MNLLLLIPLNESPDQFAKLCSLQAAFAQVCNSLAQQVQQVQQSHCWNRVTLHHLAYKNLRETFPAMGSQMVCNAIYSVSRTSRLVYQHPDSPFNLSQLNGKPLPLLRFANTCPVYFDRHTLSIKNGRLSMYTLEGRIRFDVVLSPEDESSFHKNKLREVALARSTAGGFELSFLFSLASQLPLQIDHPIAAESLDSGQIPEYVMIDEAT